MRDLKWTLQVHCNMHRKKVGKHEPILILVSVYWGARQNEFLPGLLYFYYMDII